MRDVRIAIVGAGPRGLNVLERILSLAPRASKIVVRLFDPGEPGEGAHSSSQPQFLLTNTLASQVTIFPPRDFARPSAGETGPSFTEWSRSAGYRNAAGLFARQAGETIGEDDYLPRALLGAYLNASFQQMLAQAPPNMDVLHRRARVVDIQRRGAHAFVVFAEGRPPSVFDFVYLTTGHCKSLPSDEDLRFDAFVAKNKSRNPRLGFFSSIYPIDRLERISSDAVVGVQGVGLSAYDVVAALTLGRGGRFVDDGFACRYVASGREPKLLLFSRTGLPYAARGVNQKGRAGRHDPSVFTPEAIASLHRRALRTRDDASLDFAGEVLPLLKAEMALAYRRAKLGVHRPDRCFVATECERAAIDAIFHPAYVRECSTFEAFRTSTIEHIRADLCEAERGNLASPLKAASDVVRDCRASLAAAVEHGGLNAASHRDFCDFWTPTMNRMSFGPPKRRNYELLALIDAGLVDWAGGPGCLVELDESEARFRVSSQFTKEKRRTACDALVRARIPPFYPQRTQGRLWPSLLRQGIVRPFSNGSFHPCGVDVDRAHHPVNRAGDAEPNLWAIGYPAEGARFYTHALPRPERLSAQTLDADAAVRDMFQSLQSSDDSRAKNASASLALESARPSESGCEIVRL